MDSYHTPSSPSSSSSSSSSSLYPPHSRSKVNRVRKSGTRTASKQDVKKRTIQYLAVCHDPKALSAVIRASPDEVVKSVCDAAINVQRGGSVHLTPSQKVLFRKHSKQVDKLVSKRVSLKQKRKLLTQRGGAFWIPALIGAALGGIGTALFGGSKRE